MSRILVRADDTFSMNDGHAYSGKTSGLTIAPLSFFDREASAPDEYLGAAALAATLIFGGVTGAHVKQVTDANGKTLLAADGAANEDPTTRIPRGRPYFPAGGLGKKVEPFVILDGAAAHTIAVANTGAGTYGGAFITPEFAVDLAKTPSQTGATDTIRFDAKASNIDFQTSAAKSIAPRVLARMPDKTWREATVHAQLGANAHAKLSFDPQRAAFTIQHDGPATNVTVDFAWNKRAGAKVTSAPVAVEKGDTLTFKPDWDHVETGAGELRVRKLAGAETVRKIK